MFQFTIEDSIRPNTRALKYQENSQFMTKPCNIEKQKCRELQSVLDILSFAYETFKMYL
jgi:hypothetical protein